MKNFLLIIGFFLLTQSVSAQDSTGTAAKTGAERKGYIGLMFGPSFPLGDFGDDDFYNNSQAGGAKTGFSYFIVDFGYNFHPNVGIAASWMGGHNEMDDGKVEDYFEDSFGGDWGVSAGSYGWGGLFVGPLFSIPLNKVTLDFKITAGLASGILPEIVFTGYNGTEYVHLKQESATASTLGFSVGGGIRVPISPKFNFMSRIEYVAMEPEADVVLKEGTLNGGYVEVDSYTVEQSMNTINLMFGFAYRLK